MMWLSDFYSVSNRSHGWNPRYDYHSNEGADHLMIEMPGVSRSDLHVGISGRYLTIEAKRDLGRGEQKWKRQWAIPDSINVEAIEARLESGILDVSLPLSEQGKTRTIEIQ